MDELSYSMHFYPKTIEVCWLWNSNFGSHRPLSTHVIRDHRVTKGVTCPLRFKREWVGSHLPLSPSLFPRASREELFCSSHPPFDSPGPASSPPPCVNAPLRAESTPLHAASAPLTLRAGSIPPASARCVDAPSPCICTRVLAR